jgi:hypothetical protein
MEINQSIMNIWIMPQCMCKNCGEILEETMNKCYDCLKIEKSEEKECNNYLEVEEECYNCFSVFFLKSFLVNEKKL